MYHAISIRYLYLAHNRLSGGLAYALNCVLLQLDDLEVNVM